MVETLVAIAILSISVLSTFMAVQSSLQNSLFARDQITAFYLIQEAMESVRNTRDGNALANIAGGGSAVNWLTGISLNASDPCYFGKTCIIDSPQKQMTACSGGFGTCPVINEDPASGLFGYTNGWTPTKFRREIQLQQISPDEIVVVVRVSWGSGLLAKTIQIQGTLFNTR